jgi:hypothetical protein
MSDKVITDQTAFETAGIPTPPDQEAITPTDMVSEAVEEIMDNIRKAYEVNPDGRRPEPQKH